MKTFDDLQFDIHPPGEDNKHAVLFFENGYGVSVGFGKRFYSNGIDTYELAVIFRVDDWYEITYSSGITDNVLACITKDEVTEAMRKVQGLKPMW